MQWIQGHQEVHQEDETHHCVTANQHRKLGHSNNQPKVDTGETRGQLYEPQIKV